MLGQFVVLVGQFVRADLALFDLLAELIDLVFLPDVANPGAANQNAAAIAAAAELPTNEVMLHVAGMRKYGDLVEVGIDGDYPTYQLVKSDEKKGE